jgi:hypothetical protein
VSGRHAGSDDPSELIRPFVSQPSQAPPLHPSRSSGPFRRERPDVHGADVNMLRPYLLTSGRVDASLEIEAQVVATDQGRASYHRLTFERRDIVVLCHAAMSVAEVAARLQYQIGVARVLIADLAASGDVLIRRPDAAPALDVAMIERVIRALEAIR